jgi:hypothetical protein
MERLRIYISVYSTVARFPISFAKNKIRYYIDYSQGLDLLNNYTHDL